MPAPARPSVGALPEPSEMPVALAVPDPIATEVLDRLADLEPDRMTPIEALMALADLKKTAEG